MLEIRTIQDYYTKLTPAQQNAVLKGLKTKERLDDYLDSLNDRKRRKGPPVPIWIDCHRCKHSPEPGKLLLTPRDSSDIHPSQIHRCLKKIWFDCSTYVDSQTGEVKSWAEHGVEHISPRLRRIFDFGTAWHDVVQAYGGRGAFGPKQNYRPEYKIDPDSGVCDRAEVFWIKGAVDAVIDPYIIDVPGIGKVGIRVIHEYKTINSNGYSRLNKPKPEHKWQASIYSYMLDIPIVVYLYTNKDNQQITDWAVPFSWELWPTIEEKLEKIQAYVNSGSPPDWPETSAVQSPMDCKECPYLQVCRPPQQAVQRIAK